MMDRRVPKIPGRGLPSSLMVASLPSRFPPPNFNGYRNRYGDRSARSHAAGQSFPKGSRVLPSAGRGCPGKGFPAAFPRRWEHKNNRAVRRCGDVTTPHPSPRPQHSGPWGPRGADTLGVSVCSLPVQPFRPLEFIVNGNSFSVLFVKMER